MDRIPASIVAAQGEFRSNRKGNISVLTDTLGLVELVVTIPGFEQTPTTTYRIVLAGSHLEELHKKIGSVRETPANIRRFEKLRTREVISHLVAAS